MNKEINLPPIFGITEIGKMIGWEDQKVHVYYSRNILPKPATYANNRPFWTFNQVKKWAKEKYDIEIKKEDALYLINKNQVDDFDKEDDENI